MIHTNGTTAVAKEEQFSDAVRICLFIAYLSVWFCSIFGNTLVCTVIQRSRIVQSTTNFFVVAISVADILYSLVALPFIGWSTLVGSWDFGGFMCRAVRLFQYASPGIIMWILLCVSIDRFYSIIYPLTFKVQRGTAYRMILGCWCLAIFVSSFCFFMFEQRNSEGRWTCDDVPKHDDWAGIIFTIVNVVIQYFIPIVVIGYLYMRVWRFIWRTESSGSMRIQRTENHVSFRKVKIAKMLMVSTILTLLLFAPYYSSLLWYGITRSPWKQGGMFRICNWFVFLAGVIRPLLYMYYNAHFRKGCKEVLCSGNTSFYRNNNYATTRVFPTAKRNHIGVQPSACL